jgi:hypothetical protein
MKSKLGATKPNVVEVLGKGNKGKGKQADNENAPPSPAPVRKAVKASIELGSPTTRSTRAALSPVPASPSRPAKSPLRKTIASPTPKSPPTRSSRPQSPQRAANTSANASNSRPSSRAAASPAQLTRKDLSIIAEGPSERSSPGPSRQMVRSPPRTRPQSPRLAAQQAAKSPRSPPRKEPAPQPSIDALLRPTAPVSAPTPAPVIIAPAPPPPVAAPIKSVRSSWLSKALGSGGVPVNRDSDTTSTFRKSVVSQARPTLHDDYAGLRKSLAPPNGLKRKSDQGIEEQEPAPRPEKIVKIDNPAIPAAITMPSFERKISHPSVPTPAPAPVSQTQAEILKVTKTLQAIRESTQAKELAKQKATGSGSGLLRNLTKSFGLGGRDPSDDEAERLARELEDDRQAEVEAQAQLDRLLNETGGEEVSAVKEEVETVVVTTVQRSTTPILSPPISAPTPVEVEVHPASDKTDEEEEAEEEQMVEDISFVEEEEELEVIEAVQVIPKAQPKPIAPVPTLAPRLQTPPKLASIRMSTTPINSPPPHLTQATRAVPAVQSQLRSPKPVAALARAESSMPKSKAVESVKAAQPTRKEEVVDIDEDTADEEEDEDEGMMTGMENVAQHAKHLQKGKQPADVSNISQT